MLLNISDFSEEPLQSQIVRQISERILKGELGYDDALPSIRQLAHQVKVSVITVQRAYETLEKDGYIKARRGKGFFVASIRENDRKKISKENLAGKIAPAINSALNEGLSIEDIKLTINRVIESNYKSGN